MAAKEELLNVSAAHFAVPCVVTLACVHKCVDDQTSGSTGHIPAITLTEICIIWKLPGNFMQYKRCHIVECFVLPCVHFQWPLLFMACPEVRQGSTITSTLNHDPSKKNFDFYIVCIFIS